MEKKATRARALMNEGRSIKEIAALMGVTVQYLYSLRYHDKKRAMKLKPVPKKTKPRRSKKVKAAHAQHVVNLQEAKEVLSQPPVVTATPKLTIPQRLRVLFTGRYA